MAAAVAMGLAKICSHWEKTKLDVMPQGAAPVAFRDEGEEHLRFLGPLGEVAQVV